MKLKNFLPLSVLLPVLAFAQSEKYHDGQVLPSAGETIGVLGMCDSGTAAKACQSDASGNPYANVIGSTARVCATITPDTNAFAANDIVGPAAGASGLLTFASAGRSGNYSVILAEVQVTNTEIDGIAFDFCLFNANPSGSTVASNGPLTVVAADLQKLVGCASVADGRALATTELYQAHPVIVADAAATTYYGILRTAGAPTWAAAQTVNVCLTFVQD